jgi:hypothetical protein
MQSLIANWALVALIVKSILDLIFALNPKADAPGGVIDFIYQLLKKAISSNPLPPPSAPPSAPAA